MAQKTYVGDTGTAIILDCVVDVSSANARSIEVRKPDGSLTSWPAAASGATSVRFDTMPDTLDMPGTWKLQSRVTMASGVWRGETAALSVFEHFG
jgi:hypothetical protein